MIQPVKEKIILGIDPGTNIMGYGVLKVTGVKPEVMTLGVIDLRKCGDSYLKLKHIYERVQKLGRAQGVAIVAALMRDIPVTEYAPLKIKMAITGNGQASKEQVADMLKRMLHIPDSEMGPFMDATDALGAAYCHYLQMGRPEMPKAYSSWKDFIAKNPERIKK